MKKLFEIIKKVLFAAVQFTWGLPQTLCGLFVFLASEGKTDSYRCAVCKAWSHGSGLSLGLFLFVPEGASGRITAHEYGHSLQSLILGPFYLPVIGLPSLIWCVNKQAIRYRKEKKKDYFSFYTEKTADALGKAKKEEQKDEVEKVHHTYNGGSRGSCEHDA